MQSLNFGSELLRGKFIKKWTIGFLWNHDVRSNPNVEVGINAMKVELKNAKTWISVVGQIELEILKFSYIWIVLYEFTFI